MSKYDFLRAFVKAPSTLSAYEIICWKEFIHSHGEEFENTSFEWLLKIADCYTVLSTSEIEGLIDIVDRMEETLN